MELDFQKNNLKPGDAGFVYDKRVDFKVKEKVDDGWDEEEEGGEDEGDDVDEYFDDDFV